MIKSIKVGKNNKGQGKKFKHLKNRSPRNTQAQTKTTTSQNPKQIATTTSIHNEVQQITENTHNEVQPTTPSITKEVLNTTKVFIIKHLTLAGDPIRV